jgi:hypothetical protein
MELTSEQKKSQELLQTIITKAWEDETFKQELITNPIDAIKNATGEQVNLPEGKTLIVKDQTDNATIYINIPAEPTLESMELNEEQLEIIAGGGSVWTIPQIIIPTDPNIDGFQ